MIAKHWVDAIRRATGGEGRTGVNTLILTVLSCALVMAAHAGADGRISIAPESPNPRAAGVPPGGSAPTLCGRRAATR